MAHHDLSFNEICSQWPLDQDWLFRLFMILICHAIIRVGNKCPLISHWVRVRVHNHYGPWYAGSEMVYLCMAWPVLGVFGNVVEKSKDIKGSFIQMERKLVCPNVDWRSRSPFSIPYSRTNHVGAYPIVWSQESGKGVGSSPSVCKDMERYLASRVSSCFIEDGI